MPASDHHGEPLPPAPISFDERGTPHWRVHSEKGLVLGSVSVVDAEVKVSMLAYLTEAETRGLILALQGAWGRVTE